MLNVSLALHRVIRIVKRLIVHKPLDSVTFRMAVDHFIFVLPSSPNQITRTTNVNRTVFAVRQDINIVVHQLTEPPMDPRVKPAGDSADKSTRQQRLRCCRHIRLAHQTFADQKRRNPTR